MHLRYARLTIFGPELGKTLALPILTFCGSLSSFQRIAIKRQQITLRARAGGRSKGQRAQSRRMRQKERESWRCLAMSLDGFREGRAHSKMPTTMPTTAPPSMPPEADEVDEEATATMAGDAAMAVTVMATPETLESIAVALLGALVAAAIVECTADALKVGTRMLTSSRTLPAATLTSTSEAATPAVAATAL